MIKIPVLAVDDDSKINICLQTFLLTGIHKINKINRMIQGMEKVETYQTFSNQHR